MKSRLGQELNELRHNQIRSLMIYRWTGKTRTSKKENIQRVIKILSNDGSKDSWKINKQKKKQYKLHDGFGLPFIVSYKLKLNPYK